MVALNRSVKVEFNVGELRIVKKDPNRIKKTQEVMADVNGELIKVIVVAPTKSPSPSKN